MQSQPPRSVRIFVASSAELAEHRDAFDLHVRQHNDRWVKRGLHLEPVRWEHFLDAMAQERLQDEYNRAIGGCDLFVMLFRTKVGLYTSEEFDKALVRFKQAGKPRIYTYFHDVAAKIGSLDRKDMQSVWHFQDRLKELSHFQTVYETTEGLLLHFGEQLETLYEAGAFGGSTGAAQAPPPPQAESLTPYLARRAAHWREGAAGQLDRRFVNLTLMVDHGLEFDGPRHEAQGRYTLLGELLAERPDVGAWVLVGAPGSGKSTVLQHHEMNTAGAALQALGEVATDAAADSAADGSSPDKPEVCIWHRLSEYDAEKSPPPAEWLALPTRWPAGLPPLAELRTTARVRFLLDGLNEIKAPSRTLQLQAVDRWTEWAAAAAARGEGLAPVFSVRTLDQSPMSTSGFEVRQIVLAPWQPEQIEAYCQAQLGQGNALWPTIEGDAQLLELSKLPFNLWAQCELFRALGRAARDRAELMGGLFWQMLAKRVNDAPLKPPGLLGDKARAHIASGQWKHTLRALPSGEGCLVPWLDDTLQRLHRRGRLVSVAQSELLAGLPAQSGAATPEEWLYAVRSLQLIDEGGHDEFSAEPLLRCTHQLWQEFFAARGIRDWAASQPDQLPDLRAPPLAGLDETLARLGLQEPLPGPDPTHWEEPVKLAVQLVKDPGPWIAVLEKQNLALAGRAALACRARLDPQALDRLRRALLAMSRNPGDDLRLRIEAALVLGELGDPRYEERQGPHGRYLWPRHWAQVPAGSYRIGDEQAPFEDEQPETEIELQAFEMAFAPVTNAEYRCFVEAGGYQHEQWWQGDTARRWLKEGVRNEAEIDRWRAEFAEIRKDCEAWIAARPGLTETSREQVRGWQQQPEAEHERMIEAWYGARRFEQPQEWHNPLFNAPTQPVVGLCQFEALAYAAWLQAQCGRPVRLPVEAEWEAAARGRQRRRWPWGDLPPGRWQINADPAHLRRTTPIGVFVQGDSPDGLTDLAGNVWQWTTSAYTERLEASALIAAAPEGLARRVVRGGSWYNSTDDCRPSYRNGGAPVIRDDNLGFRLVLSCPIPGP